MKAVEKLAGMGVSELDLAGSDGNKRRCRLEIEPLGAGGHMVHLFAQGDDGNEHVVLRGIRKSDGSIGHETDSRGRSVGFTGTWWKQHMTARSDVPGADFGDMRLPQWVPNSQQKDLYDFAPQAHAALVADNQQIVSANRARGTGYFPSDDPIEGGYSDRIGKRLYTLQDYLAGEAPYVSVAMDTPAAKYGSLLRIPELEAKYGRKIPFRVVDTGSAFYGRGRSRIDICTADRTSSLDSTINGPLTLLFVG